MDFWYVTSLKGLERLGDHLLDIFPWGASIKYIRTEGGGGLRIAWLSWTNSTDRLSEMPVKGRGVKYPKNFADVLNGSPLV